MDRYIEQLIEDFKIAEDNPISKPDFGNSYEEFSKLMFEMENNIKVSAKNLVGVSYEELPPADMMTVDQTQKLIIALLNALSAKDVNVSFPSNGIPVKLCYTEVRKLFKDGFDKVPGLTIDFCSGWCPDCAFVDYCPSVNEIWTKEELKKERLQKD